MRVAVLVAAIGLGLFLAPGVADAEKVRTNQTTKLLARPGEQAKVVLTVKSGQNMTLLKRDGRWLKVRVKGRTGYVPRSKVDMADDGGIARNTRRRPFVDGRGKRRGFGGDSAPEDRIGADAVGDNASGGDEETDEEAEDEAEDEEEDEPAPKKRPAKAPPAKPAAKVASTTKAGKGAEDEEEEEEELEEEEEEETEEESEEEESTESASSGGDDEDPIGGGDEEEEEEEDGEPERPTARVSKKVSVYEEPDAESNEEFVVRPTDVLYPIETQGSWTFVENAEGDGGWIETDLLEIGTEGGGGGGGKRVIDLRARAGLTIIQQGMRTAGSSVLEVPDNYNIGTSSATLSIGAGILVPKGKWLLGGEFTYDYAKAMGGGVFYDPDGPDMPMPGANIGITLHNVNVRALAGLDLKKKSGMALFGRLGYRYQGFLITDVANFEANPARLPSEVVKAPTLGAAFSIPRLTDKIGIKFSLDAILFGASVKQTVGLEDGSAPSVKALVLGTGFAYKLKLFDLMAAYDLSYMGVDFGAPVASSMRNHMGTNVKRTDIFHMLTFGIAKPF